MAAPDPDWPRRPGPPPSRRERIVFTLVVAGLCAVTLHGIAGAVAQLAAWLRGAGF